MYMYTLYSNGKSIYFKLLFLEVRSTKKKKGEVGKDLRIPVESSALRAMLAAAPLGIISGFFLTCRFPAVTELFRSLGGSGSGLEAAAPPAPPSSTQCSASRLKALAVGGKDSRWLAAAGAEKVVVSVKVSLR